MNEIPAFLDRRPLVGTYTLLNTFKNCEHQAYRRYVKRDQPYVETEAMRWGSAVHAAFAKRIADGIVLPEDMQKWDHYAGAFDTYDVACELELGITKEGQSTGYWDSNCWFRGKLDVVVHIHEKALLTDWKLGSSKYEDPLELEIHAVLLKAKFPTLTNVVGRYIYLKEEKIGHMHDLSNFARTWQQMEQGMQLIADKQQTNNWIKKKSGLCSWCTVKDCEHWKPRHDRA